MAIVKLTYFAAARDLAGTAQESLTLELPASLTSVCAALAERHPALKPHMSRFRAAINGNFADGDAAVCDGDEVVIMPPVAGGSGSENGLDARVGLRNKPLSVDEAIALVSGPDKGAVVVFIGVVRDHNEGRSVAKLDYESYEKLAITELRRICNEVEQSKPGTRVAAFHRVGELAVGDLAVVVAGSAVHRAEAFDACREVIEQIKKTVPIWKKEWDAQGTPAWINFDSF